MEGKNRENVKSSHIYDKLGVPKKEKGIKPPVRRSRQSKPLTTSYLKTSQRTTQSVREDALENLPPKECSPSWLKVTASVSSHCTQIFTFFLLALSLTLSVTALVQLNMTKLELSNTREELNSTKKD